MRINPAIILGVVAAAGAALGSSAAHAQTTNFWNGSASIAWGDPANWSGGVPAAGQIILFDPAAPFRTVSLLGGQTAPVERIQFSGTSLPSFTLEDGTLHIQDGGRIRTAHSHSSAHQTVNMVTIFEGSGIISHEGVNGGNLSVSDVSTAPEGTLTLQGVGTIVVNGPILGGGVTKTSSGLVDFNALNSYNGPTVVAGGVLEVNTLANGGQDSGIGRSSNAASNLVLDGGTLRVAGAGAHVTDRRFTIGPNGGTIDRVAGNIRFVAAGSAVEYTSPSVPRTLTLVSTGSTGNGGDIDLDIGDAGPGGAVGINMMDPSRWNVRGRNSFTGPVSMQQGTLALIGESPEGAGAAYTVTVGHLLLQPSDDACILGSLSGAGTVVAWHLHAGQIADVVVGSNGQSTTFSGRMQDGDVARGLIMALEKVGPGTLTLSGDNSFTGGVTVSGGALQLGDGGSTGSVIGDITNNATLIFNRSDDLNYGLNGVHGTGGITKLGTGTLTIDGGSTGPAVVTSGTLRPVGTFNASSVAVNLGGTLAGAAQFMGPVTATAGGVIAPDTGSEPMRISGDLSVLSGVLRISVHGPQNYGAIRVQDANVNLGIGFSRLEFSDLQGEYPADARLFLVAHDDNGPSGGATTGVFRDLPDNGDAGTVVPALNGFGGWSEWRIYYHGDAATGALTGGSDVVLAPGACNTSCPADFNCTGTVNSQDFFDYLTAFFAADARADINADGAVNSQDFFGFLTLYFAGC